MRACVHALCVCVCVCVVSVIVKGPVLPPCVVDGRSRNPLYYYYMIHNKLLIATVDIITEPLTILFNRCLNEGNFPNI